MAEIGDKFTSPSQMHGDIVWQCVGLEPYVNRNGESIYLAVWEAACVICGGKFSVRYSARGDHASSSVFERRTCVEHKFTPSEVGRLRCAGIQRRPEVFAKIKGAKLGVDRAA